MVATFAAKVFGIPRGRAVWWVSRAKNHISERFRWGVTKKDIHIYPRETNFFLCESLEGDTFSKFLTLFGKEKSICVPYFLSGFDLQQFTKVFKKVTTFGKTLLSKEAFRHLFLPSKHSWNVWREPPLDMVLGVEPDTSDLIPTRNPTGLHKLARLLRTCGDDPRNKIIVSLIALAIHTNVSKVRGEYDLFLRLYKRYRHFDLSDVEYIPYEFEDCYPGKARIFYIDDIAFSYHNVSIPTRILNDTIDLTTRGFHIQSRHDSGQAPPSSRHNLLTRALSWKPKWIVVACPKSRLSDWADEAKHIGLVFETCVFSSPPSSGTLDGLIVFRDAHNHPHR
jgi:hypothetical protein